MSTNKRKPGRSKLVYDKTKPINTCAVGSQMPQAVENEVSYEQWAVDLCSLLDAIEIALDEDDLDRAQTLVAGRFDIAENNGFIVEFTGIDGAGIQ